MPKPSSRQLIPLADGAERANLSTKTLRRYIADGRLTGYRVGPRLIKVDAAEIDQLAAPFGGAA